MVNKDKYIALCNCEQSDTDYYSVMLVRWRVLGDMENECISYNFRLFAPKLSELVEIWGRYDENNFACFLRRGEPRTWAIPVTDIATPSCV